MTDQFREDAQEVADAINAFVEKYYEDEAHRYLLVVATAEISNQMDQLGNNILRRSDFGKIRDYFKGREFDKMMGE